MSLAGGRGIRYVLYSLFLITFLAIGAYQITTSLAQGLSQVFPDILWRATNYFFSRGNRRLVVQSALRSAENIFAQIQELTCG